MRQPHADAASLRGLERGADVTRAHQLLKQPHARGHLSREGGMHAGSDGVLLLSACVLEHTCVLMRVRERGGSVLLLGGLTDVLCGGLRDPTAKAGRAGRGLGRRRRAVHWAGQGLLQGPGRLGPTCPKMGSGPGADTPGHPWLGCGRNGNLSDVNTSDEAQVGHGGPTLVCSPPAHLTPASSGQAQSRCKARCWASPFALGFLTLRCRGGRPFPPECQFFFRPLDPFHVLPGIEHKPWATGGVGGT